MASETRRSVRFAENVDPGDNVNLSKEIETAATVEQVTVRIYRGAELDLHVQPYVERGGRRTSLVEYQGKDYVDGDGDFFEFPVSEGVERRDQLGVDVENQATDYAYDFSVDVVLDRAGGTSRVVNWISGVI